MTKIQEESLPLSLEGKDLIAKAKTGSGKTLAFSLPIVNKLDVKKFKIQALVLTPTRELANQVASEIRKTSRHIHNVKVLTLCGGTPFKPQVASLSHGAHIIVATAGRLLQHIHESNLDLLNIETVVLDEADKMLDMGFYDDIMKVLENLPQKKQTLLFSATYEDNIKKLTSSIMKEAIFIEDKKIQKENPIKQIFYKVEEDEQKDKVLKSLIKQSMATSILIFCNTKQKCEELADILYEQGIDLLTLHSDFEQKQRDETLILFSNKSYPVLIATDVASRGLHVDDIELVINYDLAKDIKVHTHRIGRTARAGNNGLSISFFDENNLYKFDEIKQNFEDVMVKELKDIEDNDFIIDCKYRTILIDSGKKHKLRAGDILGSLTAGIGLPKEAIGKIDILNFVSYVAVEKAYFEKALNGLNKNKIKGKYIKCFKR